MGALIFGEIRPCGRCHGAGKLARNGRPASAALLAILRGEADVSADPQEAAELHVRDCPACAGSGYFTRQEGTPYRPVRGA